MYEGKSEAMNHVRRFAEPCQAQSYSGVRRLVQLVGNQADTIPRMDYKNEIGRRIRSARIAKGLTLKDLSLRTGDILDLKRINAYENGVRMPRPPEAAILAKALGVRPAYLMGLEDEVEEHLLRNWRTLSERERMDVYRHIETLALAARDPVQDYVVEQHLPRAKHIPPKRAKVRTR